MRKYKINEMEFFNNVEIPQNIDKQNIIIELIALITILGMTLYSLETLYIIIKHIYLTH